MIGWILTTAPVCTSNDIILKHLFWTASINGVFLSRSLACTLAPWCSRYCTTSSWPSLQATCKAVLPSWFGDEKLPPLNYKQMSSILGGFQGKRYDLFLKMEECVHRSWMPPLPAKANRGHNSRMERVVKSLIKIGFPFMVTELVYKLQIICLRRT